MRPMHPHPSVRVLPKAILPKDQTPDFSVQNAFHVGPPIAAGPTGKATSARHGGHLVRCCPSEPVLPSVASETRREPKKVVAAPKDDFISRMLTRSTSDSQLRALPKVTRGVSPRLVVDEAADPRTPSASSSRRPSKRELASLTREDVARLLTTLSTDQRDHFQKQAFYDQCRHKFHALDLNKSGYLESNELQKAVVQMFPGKQRALNEEDFQISAPANISIESIIAAFDEDSDGRISEQEFPEFVRFCQAWRLRMYFTTPLVSRPGSVASERNAGKATGSSNTRLPATKLDEAKQEIRSLVQTKVDSIDSTSAVKDDDPSRSSPKASKMSLPEIILDKKVLDLNSPKAVQTDRSDRSAADSDYSWVTDSAGTFDEQPSQERGGSFPVTMFDHEEKSELPRAKTTGHLKVAGRRKKRKASVVHTWSSPEGEMARQEALISLVSAKMDGAKPFADVVKELFKYVLARDGKAVLPEEELLGAVDHVLEDKCEEHEKPSEGWRKLVVSDEARFTDFLLAVIIHVAELATMGSNDLTGQLLWRFRSISHQRQSALASHGRAVADVSWVAGPELTDKVKAVFGLFCLEAGKAGHMHCREWLKTVHLLTKDPVLRERILQTDVDRLFYTSSHRAQQDVSTISCDDFLRLITELAESSNVHPHACYLAIGCHEEELRYEIEAKGSLPSDYMKQFYH